MEKHWQIANPCSQNWDQMNPVAQGHYCGGCCKTVMDFSDWKTGDILEYLNSNPSTCGRFRTKQLALMPTYTEKQLIPLLSRSSLSLLQQIAALFIFCFVLSIHPEIYAQEQTPSSRRMQRGQIVSPEADTVKTENIHRDAKGPESPDRVSPMIMGFVAPVQRQQQPKAHPKINAKPNPKATRPAR